MVAERGREGKGPGSPAANAWTKERAGGYNAGLMTSPHARVLYGVGLAACASAVAGQARSERFPTDGPLALHSVEIAGERVLAGFLEVPEDRGATDGRKLRLHVVVVPARAEAPRADPVFYLAGGPGQGATEGVGGFLHGWMREDRDVVLVDQRGTGKSNPLRIDMPGSDNDPGGYLEWMFAPERFRAALPELEAKADLRCYTTPIAMDDLDAVRQALGYEKINLIGSSYGTRAALVYMRQHESRVRAAVLDGVAPMAFENPLHHARSAQDGFDLLVAECEANPRCKKAYPDLPGALAKVLARLDKNPAEVEIPLGKSKAPVRARMTRDAFCDALRVLLYYTDGNRRVPAMLQQAADGDLAPFAAVAIQRNRGLSDALAFGMLMCVTAAEDLPRISEAEIRRECENTFLGDARVRAQLTIAEFWPRGDVPDDYGEPVAVDVPTLLLSGTHDPVTPPRWAAEAATHLPRSRHVVVAGCHGVGTQPRVARLVREFLDAGSVDELDVAGLDDLRMPGIVLPDGSRAASR